MRQILRTHASGIPTNEKCASMGLAKVIRGASPYVKAHARQLASCCPRQVGVCFVDIIIVELTPVLSSSQDQDPRYCKVTDPFFPSSR